MALTEIVAGDIGGTNARFAIAEVEDGRVVQLGEATTLKCADFGSLALAWEAFARKIGRDHLPRHAGIAVATPIQGDVLKMTNNPWVIQPSQLANRLKLDDVLLINDFGAVGHAVAQLGDDFMLPLCGPARALPKEGAISIVGPGTGLGAACLHQHDGHYIVLETEGGHIDFAPLDELEDRILKILRGQFRRVSTERIVSGPGLSNLYEAIARMQGIAISEHNNQTLWETAMDGRDTLAAAALERFCLSLGAVAGDLALAHGAKGVVIAGGLGQRLAGHLPNSGFAGRFIAKGRFQSIMSDIPVKIVNHPQPGLFGAAGAYAMRLKGRS